MLNDHAIVVAVVVIASYCKHHDRFNIVLCSLFVIIVLLLQPDFAFLSEFTDPNINPATMAFEVLLLLLLVLLSFFVLLFLLLLMSLL